MQMVCGSDAVLLRASKTVVTPAAYTAGKANAYNVSDFDIRVDIGTKSNDTTNALMAANMRELDLSDGVAVYTSSGACLCMKICILLDSRSATASTHA